MYAFTVILLSLALSIRGFIISPDSMVHQSTNVGEMFGRHGIVDFDGISREMTIFRGIPYAEKPVRFEKPVPKAPFTIPFAATEFGPVCPQPYGKVEDMSEDCLSLNIYVPTNPQSTGVKPVMVWIHGGGFLLGRGSMSAFERFSAFGDVIVVTLNYRLAQLGFLSINSSYIPGNYGLWDQHLAIKWVHDNIGAFGGNASEVTMFGESAGSSSVMYQTLYPGNKGLFQRAIAQSGSITSSWAKKNLHTADKNARDFARKCGCLTANDGQMIKCLSTVSFPTIVRAIQTSKYSFIDNAWTVTVDKEFVVTDQSEMFIRSDSTAESLTFYNTIELITGVNRADGLLFLLEVPMALNQTNPTNLTLTREQFETFVIPLFLRVHNDFNDVSDIAKSIVSFKYTNWTRPEDELERLRNFVKFTTEVAFTAPTITALNVRTTHSARSYFYEFAFKPSRSLLPLITRVETEFSANHGDNEQFVEDMLGDQHTKDEEQLAHAMMTMWTNFAKTGDPNQPEDVRQYYPVTWPSYDSQAQSYLEFSHQMSPQSVKQRLAADRMRMWLHLLPEILKKTSVCGANTSDPDHWRTYLNLVQ